MNRANKVAVVFLSLAIVVVFLGVSVTTRWTPISSVLDYLTIIVKSQLAFSGFVYQIWALVLPISYFAVCLVLTVGASAFLLIGRKQKVIDSPIAEPNQVIEALRKRKLYAAKKKFLDRLKDPSFEEVRQDLLGIYNTNVQNHGNYVVTVGIAVIATVGAWSFLTDRMILGIFGVYLLIIILSGLSFLIGWFLLRAVYWTCWVNYALVLTTKEIADLFNQWNLRFYRYNAVTNTPCCSAIIQSAIGESLVDYSKKSWSFSNCLRKLAIKTGNLS